MRDKEKIEILSVILYIIAFLIGTLIGAMIFWGFGNLVIWVFKVEYVWTFWHGLVCQLAFKVLGDIFGGKKFGGKKGDN